MKEFLNGIGKGAGVVVGILIVCILMCGGCCLFSSSSSNNEKDEPKKVGQVTTDKTETEDKKEDEEQTTEEEKPAEYVVGDIVELKGLRISYLSAGEYKSDNQFIQPESGNVYYKLDFECENIGNADETVSSMLGWECYADGYLVNQKFIDMDNDLSGSISSGKKLKGSLYYEIPENATDIVLEYEDNVFTSDKIVFRVK